MIKNAGVDVRQADHFSLLVGVHTGAADIKINAEVLLKVRNRSTT